MGGGVRKGVTMEGMDVGPQPNGHQTETHTHAQQLEQGYWGRHVGRLCRGSADTRVYVL